MEDRKGNFSGTTLDETLEKIPEEDQAEYPEETLDEADNRNLCIACRQREKDTSENEHSELCADCRQQLIRYPIPKWVYLLFGLITVLVLVSSYRIPEAIQDLKKYQEADLQYKERKYHDSLILYDELLSKYNQSIPITLNLVDASMEQQDYYYASYIIDTYLVGRELNDGDYNVVTKHIDLLDKYWGIVGKVDEIYAEAEEKKVPDTDRVQYISQQINQLDEQEYDKSMKLFYTAMMESDSEKGLLMLQQAYELEPKYTFLLSYIGNVQRYLGRKEDALKTYQAALELNQTDQSAIRGLAILDLLDGNKKKGLEHARKSFEIAPYEIYVPETYIIALYENGKPEEAQAVIEEAKQNEYVFDGELDAYINGNITLEQYYIVQGGE